MYCTNRTRLKCGCKEHYPMVHIDKTCRHFDNQCLNSTKELFILRELTFYETLTLFWSMAQMSLVSYDLSQVSYGVVLYHILSAALANAPSMFKLFQEMSSWEKLWVIDSTLALSNYPGRPWSTFMHICVLSFKGANHPPVHSLALPSWGYLMDTKVVLLPEWCYSLVTFSQHRCSCPVVWQAFSILGQPSNAPVWLKNERACTGKRQK